MRTLRHVILLGFAFTGFQPALGQVSDPIIPGVTVEIEDIVGLPDTRGQGAEDSRSAANIARVNFLREFPGAMGELMVHDLRGQVYRVNPQTKSVTEYMDIGDHMPRFSIGPSGLSTGLNTVAFHPEFATNGRFYTIHSETAAGNPNTPDFGVLNSGSGHTVLTEWTASNPSAATFSGTPREILRVGQNSRIHNLGDITFNPFASPGDDDYGLMYIAGGESNSSSNAQNLSSLFGKLLRIDPDGSNSANGNYGVPADNPWASDGDANTLTEAYAYGFRNLHRVSWDLESGALIGTDIGDGAVEEVNFIEKGGNYGWNLYEGSFNRGGSPINPRVDTSPFTWPAAQYDHGDGFAIAGGFVYRGDTIAELAGKFVYGDIVNGRLFYSDFDEMLAAHADGDHTTSADVYELFLSQDGQPVTVKDLIRDARADNQLPNNRTDLRFGQTPDGELYLTTKQDGWIRRLVGDGLPGDYNQDGVVDAADFTTWRDNLGEPEGTLANDFDGGVIGVAQYETWRENFGAGSPPEPPLATNPEPTSAGLLAIALAIGLRMRGFTRGPR